MAEKSHANQRKNRGPQVLQDIPLRNWYRSELEHQLNTMDIVFTNRDKVTSLIRKLEKAKFAPSSLGDDRGKNRDRCRPRPSVQEPSSTHRQSAHEPATGQGSGTNLDDPEDFLQPVASSSSTTDTRARPREMIRRKRMRLARGNLEEVQSDSSSDSFGSDEDENENLSSRTRSPPRKRPHMDFQQEVAEAVRHCIPEVVQAVVSNIGLQRGGSQSCEIRPSPTSSEHRTRFSEGDFVLSPLSLSYSVPEDLKRKVIGGKFIHLYKLLAGYAEQEDGHSYVPVPREDGSLEFSLKLSDKEKKLARRQLNIIDFSRAFLRYKSIVCKEFPNRHDELDAYLAHILDLSSRYQGNAYWLYHNAFFKRAAGLWEKGLKLPWSKIDPEILHTAISAQQCNFCDNCQSYLHSTQACPFTVNRKDTLQVSPKQLHDKPINRPASGGPMQKLDHRAYYKGEQICDNYNYRSCKRGQDCKFLHICRPCQRNHTMTNCPKLNDNN